MIAYLQRVIYLFLFFILVCFTAIGQTDNLCNGLTIRPVTSIDWKNFDYKQIGFLDTVLLHHNILILSESDHGDGTAADAQCMILKGLIDSGKINTIYTESSWLIIDKINEVLAKEGKQGIKTAVKYMRSIEWNYYLGNGFWEYLANKIIEGKVRLYGFDLGASQLIVDEMYNEAVQFESVKNYLKSIANKKFRYRYINYEWDEIEAERLKADLENFDGYDMQTPYGEGGYLAIKHFGDVVINAYESAGNMYKVEQWKGLVGLFYWMYKRTLVMKDNKINNVPKDDVQLSEFHSIRDSLMAAHFLNIYLNNQQKTKAVAIMSNYHSVRRRRYIEGLSSCCIEPSVYILDDILDKTIGKDIYNLCFINALGEHGIHYVQNFRQNSEKYPKPPKNSLEFSLQKNYQGNYCIVDLENAALKRTAFLMAPIYHKYLLSFWAQNFSGVFYIREMKPLYIFDKMNYINK